jgi:predicted lipoprotein
MGLVRVMTRRARDTAGLFNPQDVSSTLWALATLGVTGEMEMVRALAKRAQDISTSFNPQAVGNTLWALASLGGTGEMELVRALAKRGQDTAGSFNPQNVANTLWALATMGVVADQELWRAIRQRLVAIAGSCNPQNVANTLWALATMGMAVDQELLSAMQNRIVAIASEFNSQDVGNVLWARACFGGSLIQHEHAALDCLAKRVLELSPDMDDKTQVQIHQWLITVALEPSWDSLSQSHITAVKQQLGARFRQTFGSHLPTDSKTQVQLRPCIENSNSERDCLITIVCVRRVALSRRCGTPFRSFSLTRNSRIPFQGT